MKKIRIDLLMVQLGMAESRSLAQRMVMSGVVRADGEVVAKQSDQVPLDAQITIDSGLEFVSRGGLKLKEALDTFRINVEGKVCADVGASTGGFTDCLLQRAATKVYAIDVGYGILHWKLRNDPRVVVMERTNARYLDQLPEPVEIVTIDASFISLDYLFPAVKNWFGPAEGIIIALIKPQFEAGREQAKIHAGVIRDHKVHQQVLEKVADDAAKVDLGLVNLTISPIKGPKGNIEFLGLFGNSQTIDHDKKQLLINDVIARLGE